MNAKTGQDGPTMAVPQYDQSSRSMALEQRSPISARSTRGLQLSTIKSVPTGRTPPPSAMASSEDVPERSPAPLPGPDRSLKWRRCRSSRRCINVGRFGECHDQWSGVWRSRVCSMQWIACTRVCPGFEARNNIFHVNRSQTNHGWKSCSARTLRLSHGKTTLISPTQLSLSFTDVLKGSLSNKYLKKKANQSDNGW